MAAVTLTHDCDVERRVDPDAANGDFRDTWVDEISPDDNLNHTGKVECGMLVEEKGETDLRYGLLLYDLKAFLPANATITSAVWWIWINANEGTVEAVYSCARLLATFDETTVTWNTKPGFTTTGQIEVFTDPQAGTWESPDITALVTDAWDSRDGICAFQCYRTDASEYNGRFDFIDKEWGYPNAPDHVHHLRVTYTLDGKTFQALVH